MRHNQVRRGAFAWLRMTGLCLAVCSTMFAQTAPASGKLEFEVASVRENKSNEKPYSNVPLGAGPQFADVGGHFISTNMVLMGYLVFAFKPTMYQLQQMRVNLPDWTRGVHYDIQARVEGTPTKDEMRLMMQNLLADRFKMAMHHEMREVPVYALVQIKLGVLGPELKVHPADDPDCKKAPLPESVGGFYPAACGAVSGAAAKVPGELAAGGHNVTSEMLAFGIGGIGNLVDMPVVDRTGLTGTYDFTLEYARTIEGAAADGAGDDPGGPTLTEALKKQLGLKLVRQKGMVDVIVIDHLEKPSEN